MKYKKYILFLLLMIVVGNKTIYADYNCYYVSNSFSARYNVSEGSVVVDKVGGKLYSAASEPILNLDKDKTIYDDIFHKNVNTVYIPAFKSGSCPNYLIMYHDDAWPRAHYVYATNDINTASSVINGIGQIKKHYGYYATLDKSTKNDETYFDKFATNVFTPGQLDPGETINQDEYCKKLFGDPNNAGEYDKDGNMIKAPSLAYLINEVMQYIRIIVPIAIILLGTIDFATAVLSSKEDDMKKAQTKFVKRLIIGLAIFLTPVIIRVIMWLADIAWQEMGFASCKIK